MNTGSQLMTKPQLIDDALRMIAQVKKLRAIGCDDLARLVECDLQTVAARLGWD